VVSSITLGALMVLCGLAFDMPRHPDLMSAPWRTNVLEPIAIGSLAWLGPGLGGIPGWLHRTSLYLVAFALVVFGIAHFQVLTFFRAPGAPQDPDKWWDVFIVAALWGGSWALARDLRDRKDLKLGADSNRA